VGSNLKIKAFTILFVPVIFIINIITKMYPQIIEKYYSTTFNKFIIQLLSLVTGVFPFSIAEILYLSLIIILAVMIIFLLIKIKTGGFLNQLINIGIYLSVLYLLFMFLWGFNYNRFSFDKIAGIKVEKSSKQELYDLCRDLIKRANALRENVNEDTEKVMSIPGGYRSIFERADIGYEKASLEYPELGGRYGRPKRVLLSEKMSYTGITGMYMPYTGEANVNINVTDFTLPATVLHEMAHQRGFAREDEANYIAYVTSTFHPDDDFKYSGVMLALIYSMNAMARKDINSYRELAANYSEGVRRDLINDSEFWDKYRGKVEEVSNKVNNTYLKSNGQQDGVESYGRMVDLLLAEYRKNRNND
jgi:hypothetical protein